MSCWLGSCRVRPGNNLPTYCWPLLPCPVCVVRWMPPLEMVGPESPSMGGRRTKKRPKSFKMGVDRGGRRGYWEVGESEGRVLCPVSCHLKAWGLVSVERLPRTPLMFVLPSFFYNPRLFHRHDFSQSFFPLEAPKLTPSSSFLQSILRNKPLKHICWGLTLLHHSRTWYWFFPFIADQSWASEIS